MPHGQRLEDAFLTRRELLARMGNGFAAMSLAGVLAGEAGANPQSTIRNPQSTVRNPQSLNPLAVKQPHFAPKAKRVIFLFMNGGPSHVDTFDPKPMLTKHHGEPLPYSNLPTERRTGT